MQVYQWKNEALEVLNQVKKDSKASGVFGLLYLRIRTNLAGLQTDLPAAHAYH